MKLRKINLLLALAPALFSGCSNNGKDVIKFNDIFDFVSEIKVDKIQTIFVTKGYIGVAPDIEPFYKKSTENPQDFEKFVSWINDSILSETSYDLVGGSYTEIDFELVNDSDIKIRINNNTVCDDKNGDLKFYKFDLNIPEIQ